MTAATQHDGHPPLRCHQGCPAYADFMAEMHDQMRPDEFGHHRRGIPGCTGRPGGAPVCSCKMQGGDDVRDNIPGPGMPDTVALEYVRDRHGLIWRVVRDGGMAATVDYAGKNHSAGIKWLEQEHGPLVPVLSCIANDPTCPCRDGDACHYVAYPDSPAAPLPPTPLCGVKGCTIKHGPGPVAVVDGVRVALAATPVDPPGPYVVTELSLNRVTNDVVERRLAAGLSHPEATPVGPFPDRVSADRWAHQQCKDAGGGSWSIAPLRSPS